MSIYGTSRIVLDSSHSYGDQPLGGHPGNCLPYMGSSGTCPSQVGSLYMDPRSHHPHPPPQSLQRRHPASLMGLTAGNPVPVPVMPNSPSISSSLGSLILSSGFTGGGTKRGGRVPRQGQWQRQDSNSGLSDSKALNSHAAQLLAQVGKDEAWGMSILFGRRSQKHQ